MKKKVIAGIISIAAIIAIAIGIVIASQKPALVEYSTITDVIKEIRTHLNTDNGSTNLKSISTFF